MSAATEATAASTWSPPPTGGPCWIEIPAVDVQACKKFYAALFPNWEFRPATAQHPEEKIAMFMYGGKSGLGGGIIQVPASCKEKDHPMGVGVTIYHFVESIEETQEKIESLGGKSLSGKEPEGENGWYMYFQDVAGNRFAIYAVRTST